MSHHLPTPAGTKAANFINGILAFEVLTGVHKDTSLSSKTSAKHCTSKTTTEKAADQTTTSLHAVGSK
jgi:hypothetical protein